MSIRILVFGGREYPHESFVHEGLYQLTDGIPFPEVTVIHGDCNRKRKKGADYWAHTFCELWRHEGIIELPFPAKWDDLTAPGAIIQEGRYGPYNLHAGFDRNQLMLDVGKPTHALGAPGGSGTADMRERIERAIRAGERIRLQLID